MRIPSEVKLVTEKLKEKDFEAFIVGGCVRDILRGLEPKDWDITTNAKPEEIQKMVKEIKKKEVYSAGLNQTTTTYTFKFMDKDKALELLGKYKGMFEKRMQIDVNVTSFSQWADQMIKENERDIINMEQRIEERRQKAIDIQHRRTNQGTET